MPFVLSKYTGSAINGVLLRDLASWRLRGQMTLLLSSPPFLWHFGTLDIIKSVIKKVLMAISIVRFSIRHDTINLFGFQVKKGLSIYNLLCFQFNAVRTENTSGL